MKSRTIDEDDFISYEKHITQHIAGDINVDRGEGRGKGNRGRL